MISSLTVKLKDELATIALAQKVARYISPMVIYLIGDLGAGKTTFSRGLIQCLGHNGHVKSPTYGLVESYQLKNLTIHHFDLYRLSSPDELDFIGIRDFNADDALCLIEWPENGADFVMSADLKIEIVYDHWQRIATLTAETEQAVRLLERLKDDAVL